MRIRTYTPEDFETVRGWVSDERTHTMWCANLIPFPMTREGFEATLAEATARFGDRQYIAEDEDGNAVGFFCISDIVPESRELMLKFVIVNSALRGKGYGRQMLVLAAKQAFEIGAQAVQLNVFTVNAPAKKCYLAAGFRERRTTENCFAYKDEMWGRCNMFTERGEK